MAVLMVGAVPPL